MANADFVTEGSLEKSERWCIVTTRYCNLHLQTNGSHSK